VSYERLPRRAGRSKYSWKKRFQLALDGIASFSGKPLRFAVRIGLGISALSIIGLIWVLVVKYVLGTAITGWASLIFVGFFFGGLQLFFLGVVGSYVARVYEEVKGRPRYVIRSQWRSGGTEVRDEKRID
jgi:polyisoprenyl-phosphate glycosyltransferase